MNLNYDYRNITASISSSFPNTNCFTSSATFTPPSIQFLHVKLTTFCRLPTTPLHLLWIHFLQELQYIEFTLTPFLQIPYGNLPEFSTCPTQVYFAIHYLRLTYIHPKALLF